MSDIINTNIDSTPPPSISVQPTAADPATAASAVQANTTKKDFTIDTKISSMADLKKKAPEVLDQMMMGIAQSIVSRMRKHQEHLKEMMRKGRDQG